MIFLERLNGLQKVHSLVIITSPCPKTCAWGAVDRHDIPRVLEDLQKDSKTSLKGVRPLEGHGRPPEGPPRPWRALLKAPTCWPSRNRLKLT
jgi:hypothetical protein